MKKSKKQSLVKKIQSVLLKFNVVFLGLVLSIDRVYAAPNTGTESMDGFIDFVCAWLLKIGGVVALVGAVLFALGWQRDDAEGKSRGLMTMMTGFMIMAISAAKGLFGL